MSDTLFSLTAKTSKGSNFSFSELHDRVVLVVNTASQCGFTPQYEGLQKLHERFSSRGLAVVGFPCDQFGNQEPGSNDEIEQFCKVNFGVTFPLMAKSEVNGPNANEVFRFVKEKSFSLLGKDIKWNFTKFLVAKDGKTVKRFEPTTTPESLEKEIEKLLK